MRQRTRRPSSLLRPQLEALEIRATPANFTVDDDFAQSKNADFSSIQAAVLAASPGDQIRVYPGTYREQVIIPATKDNLRIFAVGNQRPVIAPTGFNADPSQAVVHVAGADNVELRGFKITGELAPAGDAAGADYGVLVDQGGSAQVRDNLITTIRDLPLSGVQEGIGIQFGRTDSAGTVLSAGSGSAEKNTIEDYQKGGIVVIGAGSNAQLKQNTIRGVGPTAVIAQNGIQVSDGATATVEHNKVSGNVYTVGTFVSTGILIFETANVTIKNNDVFDNDEGIFLFAAQKVRVEHNDSGCNRFNGIALFESTNNQIVHNDTSNNGADGINLFDSDNNLVENNFAFDNGRYGIAVEAGSTGNTVRQNHLGRNAAGDLFIFAGNSSTKNHTGQNGHYGNHCDDANTISQDN